MVGSGDLRWTDPIEAGRFLRGENDYDREAFERKQRQESMDQTRKLRQEDRERLQKVRQELADDV